MRILFLLFAAAVSAFGFSCTSTGSGAWSATGTWAACGGGVPHSSDTASIGNGHTITSSSNVTVGTVVLIGTGTVTVTSGTFQVNGAIKFDASSSCSVYNPVVTLSAGTNLKFDSLGPSSGAACRPVVANGTAGSPVTIAARASSATLQMGGGIVLTYTQVSNLSGFSVDQDYSSNHRFSWKVTHSTFTNVAPITMNSCCGLETDNIFVHAWNVHTATHGDFVFSHWIENSGILGTGKRDIVGNVFDTHFCDNFSAGGFTIVGNYFGGSTLWGGAAAGSNNLWARFDGNLIRTQGWVDGYEWPAVFGDMLNSIVFIDEDHDNPHILRIFPLGGDMALRGVVVDHAGNAGTADSGELLVGISPPAVQTYGLYDTIMLCNMYGTSSYEMFAYGYFANARSIVEHSLWCGGYVGSSTVLTFPAAQMGEGYTPIKDQLTSIRSNIFWNPGFANPVKLWNKVGEIYNNPTPTEDMCEPSMCDYNTGFGLGYQVTEPSWTGYTNQAHGYIGKFSSTPGVHDVDQDPKFVDYKRSVPLFYTKYLSNNPAAWSRDATYSVGDVVKYTDSALFYGLPVAYRYQNIGACASTNPQPGSGTNWRDCWEWATLKWLRDNVALNTLFDDPRIGVSQQDAIAAVWAWIRAGYSPTNSQLAGAAHDGGDIGPMPVTFEIPSGNGGGGGGQIVSVIRGSRIKGAVMK